MRIWNKTLCLFRVHFKCDGTRRLTGGEVNAKIANVVGSQKFSHYSVHGESNITTVDVHDSAAYSRLNWRPPPIWMYSSVFPKKEIWFLRVCHHISNAVYDIRNKGNNWLATPATAVEPLGRNRNVWIIRLLACVWNLKAHKKKEELVCRWNGRVHLNRQRVRSGVWGSVQSTTGSRLLWSTNSDCITFSKYVDHELKISLQEAGKKFWRAWNRL